MKKWFKAHGCSLYGDLSDDKDTIEFTDIIVNEGTEELRLAGIEEAVNKIVSYDFKSCGRTFLAKMQKDAGEIQEGKKKKAEASL